MLCNNIKYNIRNLLVKLQIYLLLTGIYQVVSAYRRQLTLYFKLQALRERWEDAGIDAREKWSRIVLQILFLSRDLPLTPDKSNIARRVHLHCTAEGVGSIRSVLLSSLTSVHVQENTSMINVYLTFGSLSSSSIIGGTLL